MSGGTERPAVRFEPLRPASRGSLIAAFTIGPLAWLVALVVTAWVLRYTSAIALALLVALGSWLVSMLVLCLVYAARRRRERRYADGG